MTAPLVVHCKRAKFDVYVGRGNGSTWGNPAQVLAQVASEGL